MQKYKLKNIKTGEEHLCEKITVNEFDYYIINECDDLGGWHIDLEYNIISNPSRHNVVNSMKKIIVAQNVIKTFEEEQEKNRVLNDVSLFIE